MEKIGTFKKNGDQKNHFGPHGDQSPQMGTNVGAVQQATLPNYFHVSLSEQSLTKPISCLRFTQQNTTNLLTCVYCSNYQQAVYYTVCSSSLILAALSDLAFEC